MKALSILIFIFMVFSLITAQEKPVTIEKPITPEKAEDKVDKKLDPMYFPANLEEIIRTRKPLFRVRKGDVPELVWKIKTNGVVTAPPILIDTKLLIATSNGLFNYIDFKTGEVENKAVGANGGTVVWCAIQNDNWASGMSIVGSNTRFLKGWEQLKVTSIIGQTKEVRPLGALVWSAGCIMTRRNKFPVMLDTKEDKIVSEPNRAWSNGETTAPLINSGSAFWIATSKGELISFDTNLTTVDTVIKLDSSFATAIGSEGVNLYALTAGKELVAYDTTTSTLKWKVKVEGLGVDSIVCEAGLIYVNAGSFYVINGKDGGVLLERKSISYEGFMRTKPVLTDKRVLSCDSEGNLYIFNKSNLNMIQAINLEEDVMVNFYYKDKVVYIPTIASNLYALDISLY